ncbi:diacylglycerol/lipid kinase family protein [Erythrobacter rubeus]|uniref:DAGKc domain-containing protein n=1 Tax=Erythrobacter rubeus TaxID=2760803 RepID=A0ABR8KUL4_9SPHN|nr:diacylglycerol kinase family protein [Erythrobacter rubeus]MBD2843112.1 hypothetical protein [Erythrobacter rubeus]
MATPIYEFAQMPRPASGRLAGASRRPVRLPGEAPSVGVIYNPRSHGNQGADFDCGVSPHVHIAKPGDRSQLPTALTEFASRGIELLVINGGDGTVRDVLTSGAAIFGDSWPAIAVLPKGKTNALTVDLGVPAEWNLQDAIDALDNGSRVYRRPIEIDAANDLSASKVLGFILGAGSFTKATQAGQSAHRLGAFNSLAVGVTTAWTIAQALFAGSENPWRKGSRMRVELGANRTPMAHSGRGDVNYRQLLFASTLERLPAGTHPFGKLKTGLKIVALDQISRRTAALLPIAIMGREIANPRERGIHQLSAPEFTLEIDDQFILDGEAFPAGKYHIGQGPELQFVVP